MNYFAYIVVIGAPIALSVGAIVIALTMRASIRADREEDVRSIPETIEEAFDQKNRPSKNVREANYFASALETKQITRDISESATLLLELTQKLQQMATKLGNGFMQRAP